MNMVKIDREKELGTIVTWAKTKGYSGVKSILEEYDTPFSYEQKDGNESFTPDVTAIKNGCKSYFELVDKSEEESRSATKWKLLGIMAEMKGGKLFLLAPSGQKAYAQRILSKFAIKANLISI
jgi:hypothetical protein